jgi:hypothetical protein
VGDGGTGTDPTEFGESREERPSDGLALRVGFTRPLYVEYAVREDVRAVFLRRFVLLRK